MTRLAWLPAVGLLVLLLAWASEPTAGAMGIALAQATGDVGRILATGLACALVVTASGAACALVVGVHHVTAAHSTQHVARYIDDAPRPALGQPQALDVAWYVREEHEAWTNND